MLLGALVLVFGCTSDDGYYIVGEDARRTELRDLLETLNAESIGPQEAALAAEQVAGHLVAAGHPERMTTFLTGLVEDDPQNPYNAFYLYLVAHAYLDQGAEPLAEHYLHRIVRRYPDVEVRGESIRYGALTTLIRICDKPSLHVEYYRELLDYYPDRIDTATTYYRLAKVHEDLGEWENAYAAYKRYLAEGGPPIPGAPDARQVVADAVEFYESSRDWTMDSLDDLVRSIKVSLYRKNPSQLLRHKAEVNFFSMTKEQMEADENSQITFDIGIFLTRSNVRYARDLEMNSNAREAYLRTWGWSHRIPTWYLYFRRVDFPADPDINGNWEWAGIFFGETL